MKQVRAMAEAASGTQVAKMPAGITAAPAIRTSFLARGSVHPRRIR